MDKTLIEALIDQCTADKEICIVVIRDTKVVHTKLNFSYNVDKATVYEILQMATTTMKDNQN